MSTTIDPVSELGFDDIPPDEVLGADAPTGLCVRPATRADEPYLYEAFNHALSPFYGGDHEEHAKRLLCTHLDGGVDRRGLLSTRQLLLVLWHERQRVGLINLVFKRQATCKISPLILHPSGYRNHGFGAKLLERALSEAQSSGARQLYCTVAERNSDALAFFRQFGFVMCGRSEGQYKKGETEIMLRRPLDKAGDQSGPASVISVTEIRSEQDWATARDLLLETMSPVVQGSDAGWLESLRSGPGNSSWVFSAKDRLGQCRGAAIGTRKKGGAVKIMPIAATDVEAFRALAVDLPALLAEKGRKAYLHIAPDPCETAVLQETGWKLESQIPEAYSAAAVTEQWGCELGPNASPKKLRIHRQFLELIRHGVKTLEIRVGYNHVKLIRPGDELALISGSDTFVCHVANVRCYPDFVKMLKCEDIERALPGVRSTMALHELRKIYPRDKERLGILVFELKIPTS